jgi:hypothetical protein
VLAATTPGRSLADYDEMLRRFKEAKEPQTEERYRQGLTMFDDTALCLQTFNECFDRFRTQDAPIVIARLTGNAVGGKAVWQALTERWDEVLEKVPPMMQFALGIGLFFQVADQEFYGRAKAFHTSHPLPAGQMRIDQALERLATSVHMADRERPRLATTLS